MDKSVFPETATYRPDPSGAIPKAVMSDNTKAGFINNGKDLSASRPITEPRINAVQNFVQYFNIDSPSANPDDASSWIYNEGIHTEEDNYDDLSKQMHEAVDHFMSEFCYTLSKSEKDKLSSEMNSFLKSLCSLYKCNKISKCDSLFVKYFVYYINSVLFSACMECLKASMKYFSRIQVMKHAVIIMMLFELVLHGGKRVDDFNKLEHPANGKFLINCFLSCFHLAESFGIIKSLQFYFARERLCKLIKVVDSEQKIISESYPLSKLEISPFFNILTEFLWGKGLAEASTIIDEFELSYELKKYFIFTCGPEYLCDTIFNGRPSCVYDDENIEAIEMQGLRIFEVDSTDTRNSADSATARENKSKKSPQPFNVELLRFGEEFEFSKMENPIEITRAFLENKITDMNLPESEYKITKETTGSIHKTEKLEFRIGNWHCKYYNDVDDVFEINCSPYQMNQSFTIDKKKYSAYELFNLFIIPLGKENKLTPVSGHKHIDIKRSIGDNPELLCRMLIDVQNQEFLSLALDRDVAARNYFPYFSGPKHYYLEICDNGCDPVKFLKVLTEKFNERVNASCQCTSVKFYRHAAIFSSLWSVFGSYQPFTIRLDPDCVSGSATDVCIPDGTIEARMWRCSEFGVVAKRVNEFMEAWILKLACDQKQHKNINYNSLSREEMDRLLRNPSMLRKRVDNFCISIGLEPEDFYCMFDKNRIGID